MVIACEKAKSQSYVLRELHKFVAVLRSAGSKLAYDENSVERTQEFLKSAEFLLM